MRETKEKYKGRNFSFDCLRVFAAFAVVMLHVSAQNFSVSVRTFEWNVYNFYDGAVRWSVPIFVMISGALFLNPDKYISFKKLYTKYIFRIIILFITWSFLYTLRYSVVRGVGVKDCIRIFFTGHYHLWFLQMTIGLYMLIPVLKKITESVEIMRYFLLLGLLMTFIIPAFLQCPNIGILRDGFSNMKFYMTLGYTFYFIMGYYLSNEKMSPKIQKCIYGLGLIGFAITIGMSAWLSWQNGSNRAMYNDFSVNVMLESIGVFVFAKYHFEEKKVGKDVRKCIETFSRYTLGIYLVHPFILAELKEDLGFGVTSFWPVLSVPVLSIIIFASSFALVWLLLRIPKVGAGIV